MNTPSDIEAIAETAWMDAVYTLWARGHLMGPSWYRLSAEQRRENVVLAEQLLALHRLGLKSLIVRESTSEIRCTYAEKINDILRNTNNSYLAKFASKVSKVWNPEALDKKTLRLAYEILRGYVDVSDLTRRNLNEETIFEELAGLIMRFPRQGMNKFGGSPRPKKVEELVAPFGYIVDNMLKDRTLLEALLSDSQVHELSKMKPDVAHAVVETLRNLVERDAERDPGRPSKWDIKNFDAIDLVRLGRYVEAVQKNRFETRVSIGLASEFIEWCIGLLHGGAIWKLARLAYGQAVARAVGEWNLHVEQQNEWCKLTRDIIFAPVLILNRIDRPEHENFKRSVLQFANQYFCGEITKAARDWHEKVEGREPIRLESMDPIKTRAKEGVNDEVLRRVEEAERVESTAESFRKATEEVSQNLTDSEAPACDACNPAGVGGSHTHKARIGAVYTAYHPDDVSYFPGAPDDVRDVLPAFLGRFTIGGNIFTIDAALIEGSPLVLRLFPNANNDLNQAFHTKRDFGILFRPPHGQGTQMGFRLFGLTARPETYTCQADGNVFRENLSCTFDRIELWSPKGGEIK